MDHMQPALSWWVFLALTLVVTGVICCLEHKDTQRFFDKHKSGNPIFEDDPEERW